MYVKTRAIVLNSLKYNETNQIVCLFTEELGGVSCLVKRGKPHKGPNQTSYFQPLTLLELEVSVSECQKPSRLRNLNILVPYRTMPFHHIKSAMAFYLSEFLYFALRKETQNAPVFRYILSSLVWFDQANEHFSNFHITFQFLLAKYLGVLPKSIPTPFAKPSNPHPKSLTEPQIYFDLQNVCFSNEQPSHPYFVQGGEAQFVLLLPRLNFATMHLFRFNRIQRNRLLHLLNTYYSLHVPQFPALKSLTILQEIFDE